jgi:hypothetical protein
VLVAMFVVLAGLVLEATLGARLLMTRARDYRAWAWGALPALFLAALILMWLLSQRSDDFKRRFPTGWVRVAFALPLTGAMLAAALVAAPPGWIALGGWLVGRPVHDVPARVVARQALLRRSRLCQAVERLLQVLDHGARRRLVPLGQPRSMPTDWAHSMNGVPPCGLPKISSSVGRSVLPTLAAPAAWSMRANTVRPRSLAAASKRSSVAFALCGLLTAITPPAARAGMTRRAAAARAASRRRIRLSRVMVQRTATGAPIEPVAPATGTGL